MYKRLMEIMGRLETVEKGSKQKNDTLNHRIDTPNQQVDTLKKQKGRYYEHYRNPEKKKYGYY